jgi:TolB-like protein
MDIASATLDASQLVRLRAAVHVDEVVEDVHDVFGNGVNIIYRMVSELARPGQTVITAAANEELLPGMDPETDDLGDRRFKHLEEPVRCFRVCPGAVAAGSVPAMEPPALEDLLPTLAVFPFASEGSSDGGLVLGNLLADDLICALGRLPELRVVSRLSTSALAVRGDALAQAGPMLRADYAVVGRCTVLGSRVVVHAQCVHVPSGDEVCALRLFASEPELLSAENPVVTELVQAVGQALLRRHVAQARRYALPSISSFGLLVGGIALMHRLSRADFERARHLLLHLAERWPRLAVVHAWLGRWHLFHVQQGWSADPVADRQQAQERCRIALDLDAESSVALSVAGSVQVGLLQDVDGAIDLYQQALRANPSDSFAWMLLGTAHAFKGEGQSALPAAQQATRLSPLDPMHFLYDCHAAAALLVADEPAQACTLAERSLRANAQHLSTYRVLAIGQMLAGDEAAARRTVQRLLALDASQSVAGYLRASPSARYPVGQRFAHLLGEAGLPAGG